MVGRIGRRARKGRRKSNGSLGANWCILLYPAARHSPLCSQSARLPFVSPEGPRPGRQVQPENPSRKVARYRPLSPYLLTRRDLHVIGGDPMRGQRGYAINASNQCDRRIASDRHSLGTLYLSGPFTLLKISTESGGSDDECGVRPPRLCSSILRDENFDRDP